MNIAHYGVSYITKFLFQESQKKVQKQIFAIIKCVDVDLVAAHQQLYYLNEYQGWNTGGQQIIVYNILIVGRSCWKCRYMYHN